MLRTSTTPRMGWPLVLLLAGLGCLALATIEAQRSIRSNRAIADAASYGYARFAAWSYQQHLTEAMRAAAREVLGPFNHGNAEHTGRRIPDAREAGHWLPYDRRCSCHRTVAAPMPVAFFGFALGSDTIAVGGNQALAGMDGWLSDPKGTPENVHVLDPLRRHDPEIPLADRQWLLDTLSQVARGTRSSWGYDFVIAKSPTKHGVYITLPMPTSWGDTIVYAAEFPRQAFDSMLAAVLDDEGLLPDAIVDRANREILALQVSDASGEPLFTASAPAEWRLDAVDRMAPSYGGMAIRVQIQPRQVDRMVIGGLPRSRLPLLLALLALAAGLTVAAVVQLRREARFARSRALFVANVSHELRTPLAQIRLVVDTLRLGREPDPDRRASSLATVDREVTRLQHLVESVLRFARGGNGAEAHRGRGVVDAADEVKAVVAEFAPLAQPRRVSIEVAASGKPRVSQQTGALRQVLLNLLDNAVKYGPDEQTITVGVAERDDGGARITVRDQGPGIRPSERDRIWEAFERGSTAQALAVGGSGIGLTIVREIVTMHGGTVAVVDDGPGGEFQIDWPGADR